MSAPLVGVVEVINERGLHTRMATIIVHAAKVFASQIELSNGKTAVDAKSVMAVLTLAAKKGTKLTLTVSGTDQDRAFHEIKTMIENGFSGVED